jgi:putative SbcD/Mre11-related phosphoesterase
MKILKGIEIKDLGLVVGNNLIIADTHVGYEESLNKQGVFIPRFVFKEMMIRLEKILSGSKFDKIIINGDVKHEFGKISDQEWRNTLKLLDFLGKFCDSVVLIKGNHDKIVGPIASKRKVNVVDHVVLGDVLVVHGNTCDIDKLVDGKIKTIVIGHEHPAVSIKTEVRSEIFKCFLVGKWKKLNLVVQPSFNLVTEGTDVLRERLLSPFLKQDISKFSVYVVADKIYDFGKLKNLK